MPNGMAVASFRRITVFVLAGALTIGAAFHWIDIYQAGFLPYKAAPLASNIFWTMLAVVDLRVSANFEWTRRSRKHTKA
jgi:hypothetical protein